MSSTAVDIGEKRPSYAAVDETPIASGVHSRSLRRPSDVESSEKPASDNTHRKLKPRHIQLIGIGGTIGTALYVNIGKGLLNGGPGSLFLAFTIWYVDHLSLDTIEDWT